MFKIDGQAVMWTYLLAGLIACVLIFSVICLLGAYVHSWFDNREGFWILTALLSFFGMFTVIAYKAAKELEKLH